MSETTEAWGYQPKGAGASPGNPPHGGSGAKPPPCRHDYEYLGLQWWDDGQLRPGSGATTIYYVNTFFCRHCLNKVFERTDMSHSSYEKRAANTVPVSQADRKAAQDAH